MKTPYDISLYSQILPYSHMILSSCPLHLEAVHRVHPLHVVLLAFESLLSVDICSFMSDSKTRERWSIIRFILSFSLYPTVNLYDNMSKCSKFKDFRTRTRRARTCRGRDIQEPNVCSLFEGLLAVHCSWTCGRSSCSSTTWTLCLFHPLD